MIVCLQKQSNIDHNFFRCKDLHTDSGQCYYFFVLRYDSVASSFFYRRRTLTNTDKVAFLFNCLVGRGCLITSDWKQTKPSFHLLLLSVTTKEN